MNVVMQLWLHLKSILRLRKPCLQKIFSNSNIFIGIRITRHRLNLLSYKAGSEAHEENVIFLVNFHM
uniref:AlNc14C198G8620 protein n=1 Tax=Albugo laibachii Nc14 TaxID=890382 RepID=F0WQF0_9STRA|nr:AlNc14C198G8620 [Albugo laibachii Nc14]|eukprot:CCA23558.1 AlNc14C198G8620 [Albugo laibachii Nc14]